MTDLRLDWCSYDAAKYAVQNWHYSEQMPAGKTLKIGVWEDNDFIGSVIYSRGANQHIAEPYSLDQIEVCELTRVALTDHDTPVTRILSISRKLLTGKCPGLRLVVSYADPEQDHTGGIYQADNWEYHGRSASTTVVEIDGVEYHKRTVYSNYGTNDLGKLRDLLPNKTVQYVKREGKHKYVYPLDSGIEGKVEGMAKPYP